MPKHTQVAEMGGHQAAKKLVAKDSAYLSQSANIKLADKEAVCNILHRIHGKAGTSPDMRNWPNYKLPGLGYTDITNYDKGTAGTIAKITKQRDGTSKPQWLPDRNYMPTVQDIAQTIRKIGEHDWLSDDNLQSVLHYVGSHRWDLTGRIAFEPYPGTIGKRAAGGDLLGKLPRWYQNIQANKTSLLVITASVPFNKKDEAKGVDNHWVSGILDMNARTLYVVDAKRYEEELRARILLERVQRFWKRLGDGERYRGPVRAQIIRTVEQMPGDGHSCGPRVLDWIIRLLYFPATILDGALYNGLTNPERIWIEWYAAFIGVQPTGIRLTHYKPAGKRDAGNGRLYASSPEPVVDMASSAWRKKFQDVTKLEWKQTSKSHRNKPNVRAVYTPKKSFATKMKERFCSKDKRTNTTAHQPRATATATKDTRLTFAEAMAREQRVDNGWSSESEESDDGEEEYSEEESSDDESSDDESSDDEE
ncbi:hypothetical protein BJ166DRAFT_500371 [Pestalotiopsis sp. NC0098]|nr:hypothetical protein BJ166DRAFT_500371 [Pestalotiopsis sp. NC0098]